MQLTRHSTPADFLAAATPFLLEREAENNLILGFAQALAALPPEAARSYFTTVSANGRVQAAAFSTIPDRVGITRTDANDALDRKSVG